MSAKAAAAPETSADIVALLEDREMSLSEVAAVLDAKTIGKAWAAGHIEFGQPVYCVAGPSGGEGSILILEGGIAWTGPKTVQHKHYAALAGESVPECGRYERADMPMVAKHDPKNDRTTYHRPAVGRDEAVRLLALRVRLTDKGLATLSV
jgi:hypothetical protein